MSVGRLVGRSVGQSVGWSVSTQLSKKFKMCSFNNTFPADAGLCLFSHQFLPLSFWKDFMFGWGKGMTILLPVVSRFKEAAENSLCNNQADVNQFEKNNWKDET